MDGSLPDLSVWDLAPHRVARRIQAGTNNMMWALDETFIVRLYQNLDAGRVAAEHRLVTALDATGELPFAVPVPIRTVDGDTVWSTERGPVAVFRYLPGRPAVRGDLDELGWAAEALGWLDRALAGLPPELAPVDWCAPLSAVHPAVPDVEDLIAELEDRLPGDPGVERMRRTVGPADERYAELVDTLPIQIVHGDFALSNVLIADGRITAVLDFEIAGLDIRVNDPAAALAMAIDPGAADYRVRVAAFRRGYSRAVSLTPEEAAAIPDLLHYRGLGTIVWRAGRWRQGLASLEEVRERLAWLVGIDPVGGSATVPIW